MAPKLQYFALKREALKRELESVTEVKDVQYKTVDLISSRISLLYELGYNDIAGIVTGSAVSTCRL